MEAGRCYLLGRAPAGVDAAIVDHFLIGASIAGIWPGSLPGGTRCWSISGIFRLPGVAQRPIETALELGQRWGAVCHVRDCLIHAGRRRGKRPSKILGRSGTLAGVSAGLAFIRAWEQTINVKYTRR